MPASDSGKGELRKTDYLKIARMGIVIVAAYCGVAIVEAVMRDLSNGAFGIPPELTAPLTGVLSLFLEALRRAMVPPAQV